MTLDLIQSYLDWMLPLLICNRLMQNTAYVFFKGQIIPYKYYKVHSFTFKIEYNICNYYYFVNSMEQRRKLNRNLCPELHLRKILSDLGDDFW